MSCSAALEVHAPAPPNVIVRAWLLRPGGLFVAAEAVRRRMNGQPWEQICRERLFDPIGVGDPAASAALIFVTTDSPTPPERTVPLRNGVTDRVFAALRSK